MMSFKVEKVSDQPLEVRDFEALAALYGRERLKAKRFGDNVWLVIPATIGQFGR